MLLLITDKTQHLTIKEQNTRKTRNKSNDYFESLPYRQDLFALPITTRDKKDGYRQQNVRQRQKLISIIDYDICILEYLQQFWRYSPSKNGLTLKSGYGVLQGH